MLSGDTKWWIILIELHFTCKTLLNRLGNCRRRKSLLQIQQGYTNTVMYLAARRAFFHLLRRGSSFGTAWHGSHLSSCTAAGPWRRARSSAGSGCPSPWRCKTWLAPSWALLALLSAPAARQERLLSTKQHPRSSFQVDALRLQFKQHTG